MNKTFGAQTGGPVIPRDPGRHHIKVRRSALALASCVVATSVALLAVPALATGPTRTLTFTAMQTSQHNFPKHHFIITDKDLVKNRVIGNDVLIFTHNGADITIGLPQGFIYGHLTLSSTGAATGKITGGTRHFKGDTGTIKAPATKGNLIVTITYHH